MFAALTSATIIGVEAIAVRVEAFISSGLPSFTIVGLPGAAVQESRERVRANLKLLGLSLPPSRILVNLAPADVRKEGPALDLAIALALLAADRRVPLRALDHTIVFGELALDGSLRAARGAVAIALLAARLERSAGSPHRILAPPDNAEEAALVPGVEVFAPATLAAAVGHLTGRAPLQATAVPVALEATPVFEPDLADVRAQAFPRRALEVAAAGGHSLLLTGPPGAGKSMLARRLPSVLPPLDDLQAIETSRVHSAAGMRRGLVRRPPFRHPHHSASLAGIMGGGAVARPGEASLAHNGVLFLDELPEFSRAVLESLRQPLEDGVVTISRASGSLQLPARFQLVAARNPCPCGYYGADTEDGPNGAVCCTCTPTTVANYRRRLSGPLLDRFDLRVGVARLTDTELLGSTAGEPSASVALRVAAARRMATARQGGPNAHLMGPELTRHAYLNAASTRVMEQIVRSVRLSARGYDRLLRVARTLADLVGAARIEPDHLLEAAHYRGD